MTVVSTGSSTTGFSLTTTNTSYFTRSFDVITSGTHGVTFTTTASNIDYILAGSLIGSENGVNLSSNNASNFHRFTVMPTGTIFSNFDGMDLNGNSGFIHMLGTIVSSTDGLEISGDDWYFDITGTITAGTDGIEYRGNRASITISKTGQILADDDGIEFFTGDGHEITNHGLIQSDFTGVQLSIGADHYLMNFGTIAAQDALVNDSDTTRIINNGDIYGTDHGLYSSGDFVTFINNGTFSAGRVVEGIEFFGTNALLKNTGEIQSDITMISADGRLVNDGVISGDILIEISSTNFETVNRGEIMGDLQINEAAQTILNSGAIFGDVALSNGENIYRGGGYVEGSVSTGDDNDRLMGGDRDDRFISNNGNDVLWGKGGDDFLSAGAGIDEIRGGKGDDEIFAGNGADTIRGGMGNDSMTGGNGNDVFIFDRMAGDDVINDFTNGQDQIDLSAFGFNPGNYNGSIVPALSNAGGGATFLDLDALGGSGSVLIQGLAFANADAADFIL